MGKTQFFETLVQAVHIVTTVLETVNVINMITLVPKFMDPWIYLGYIYKSVILTEAKLSIMITWFLGFVFHVLFQESTMSTKPDLFPPSGEEFGMHLLS